MNSYRKEVDGLRAIAVISVLVFHFFPNQTDHFFFGYLGVDIFFVLSGYLIGLNIYRGVKDSKFSFKSFYLRRVKRIIPAAFVVLFITTIGSIILFTPYDLDQYIKSLLASLLFIPNFFFWRTGGYFGDADSLKPLLHYWSLGVEEQFYLFFPLIFLLLIRYIKNINIFIFCILLICFLSLSLSIYLISIDGSNPAFFLLPTRIWEFGAGVLVAVYISNFNQLKNDFFAFIGLLLILISFLIPLPSLIPAATLIVFFTALVLVLEYKKNSLSYKFLSNNSIRYIGKISFSLYLLHWPIIVFINYIYIDNPPLGALIFGLTLTLVLSDASYRFIEYPFRYKINTSLVFAFICSLFLFLISLSLFHFKFERINFGNSDQISVLAPHNKESYRCDIKNFRVFNGIKVCAVDDIEISKANTVLLGNSHIGMYTPIFSSNNALDNKAVFQLNGCLPTENVNISRDCSYLASKNLDAILSLENLEVVIIGTTYYANSYHKEDSIVDRSSMLDDLSKLIKKLKERELSVYLISPIPIPGKNLSSLLSRQLKFGEISENEVSNKLRVSKDIFMKEFESINKKFEKELGKFYLKPYLSLCDIEFCYYGDENGLYYSDSDHLNYLGLSKAKNNLDIKLNE